MVENLKAPFFAITVFIYDDVSALNRSGFLLEICMLRVTTEVYAAAISTGC